MVKVRRMKITIDVDEETGLALEGLARHAHIALGEQPTSVTDVLEHLVQSVSAGVRRPGAWERSWLRQAFADDWEAHLEPYDDFYERFPS